MPDDVTEADDELREQQGIENHPHGRILIRTFRTVKLLITRGQQLEARVKALEDASQPNR